MSNNPAIDSFLAYSELMKASDNIENLTYEEACLLDPRIPDKLTKKLM